MSRSTSTASCWTMRRLSQVHLGDQLAQAADARRMHFDAEIVVFRMRGGNRRRSLAHAETDFEIRGAARPNSASRSTAPRVGNADAGHHRFVIALLGVRDAPLAANETADVPGATAVTRSPARHA
jgi:hypothetical protein